MDKQQKEESLEKLAIESQFGIPEKLGRLVYLQIKIDNRKKYFGTKIILDQQINSNKNY